MEFLRSLYESRPFSSSVMSQPENPATGGDGPLVTVSKNGCRKTNHDWATWIALRDSCCNLRCWSGCFQHRIKAFGVSIASSIRAESARTGEISRMYTSSKFKRNNLETPLRARIAVLPFCASLSGRDVPAEQSSALHIGSCC